MAFTSGYIMLSLLVVINSYDDEVSKKNTTTCGVEQFPLDISCHHLRMADEIPAIDEAEVADDSIFFIQTICNGGLNVHQACAVESAARAHPNRDIHVFFAGPVPYRCLSAPQMAAITKYTNVKLSRINFIDYISKSPLDVHSTLIALSKTPHPTQYALEILKYVTLLKFGGIFLDFSVITVKSFDDLGRQNWIGKLNSSDLDSTVISLSKRDIGRALSYTVLRRIRESILDQGFKLERKYDFDKNIFKELVELFCSVNIVEISREVCLDFKVYNEDYFYPVTYIDSNIDFATRTGKFLRHPYAYHIGDDYAQATIYDNFKYGLLTSNYCPFVAQLVPLN